MSNLHCQLVQQSDHLSGMMTNYADKELVWQNKLDDKNTNVDNLMQKVELDDAKYSAQQIKLKTLSVKQEIAIMTKVKDEGLAEREELISEQNDTIGKHSMELEQQQKECWESYMHLNKDLIEMKEELVVARQEMSNLNNQQSYLLSTEMDDDLKLENILAYRKRIDWKNVHKLLELDNKMVKEKLNDAEELAQQQQQLKMQHLTVEEELKLSDEKIVESKCQIEADKDAASTVEYKENQKSLPKQHAETTALPREGINKIESDDEATALPQEGINKIESDDKEKIADSKCPTEANNDGDFILEKKENQNFLHKQHAGTTALPQDATSEVERCDPIYIPIISDSCKEVSH